MALACEKEQAICEAELVSSFLDGKDEGIAEAKAKGFTDAKAEAIAEVAKSILADGESVEIIAKYTGLSSVQIKALMPRNKGGTEGHGCRTGETSPCLTMN